MEVLSVDLGHYSVKFLRGRIERREFYAEDIVEEILAPHLPPSTDEDEDNFVILAETQIMIIKSYLEENPDIEKLVINFPNQVTTTRFLNIPVKNKKKAEQIIPFQLEDELPFPIFEAHMANLFFPQKESMDVISSITKQDIFEFFLIKLKQLPNLPDAIIAEESVFQNIVSQEDIGEHIAIIDLGHTESKCYMFHNKRLIDTQTSFLAGQTLDEVIEETYQVSKDDAVLFKHQNSFLLTDDQLDSVDKKQKDFALLMKKAFQHLINDFKRWKVGYRIKTGQNITKVYICGGTSNIKNIENFLSQSFEVSVAKLDTLNLTTLADLGLKEQEMTLLNKIYGQTQYFLNKKIISNFRQGQYASSQEGAIPLQSISFMALRSAIVAAIIVGILFVESMYINKNLKSVNSKITPILKNPDLQISNTLRRRYRKNPEAILNHITQSMETIDKEADMIQKSSRINAIRPLANLSNIVDPNDAIELRTYESTNNSVLIKAYAEKIEIIDKLKTSLESNKLDRLRVDIDKNSKVLTASYFDED